MEKKFLIVNENGSDNIGDHAINEGLIEILTQNGFQYAVAPFSTVSKECDSPTFNKKASGFVKRTTKSIKGIKLLVRIKWWLQNRARIISSINTNLDGVIIGGGQLILKNETFSLAMYLWVSFAHKKGIPIYLVGVGCGESLSRIDTCLYKAALKKCKFILTREYSSIDKIRHFFDCEASYVPDLAFGLSSLAKSDEKRTGVVVGVTDYKVYLRYKNEINNDDILSYESYINAWLDKTRDILNDDREKITLISTTHRDNDCNIKLYSLLTDKVDNPVELVSNLGPLNDYRIKLAQSRVVFSGRMHSLILAKIEGCNIEPWIISSKIDNFMQDYKNKTKIELENALHSFIVELK